MNHDAYPFIIVNFLEGDRPNGHVLERARAYNLWEIDSELET